MSKLRARHSLRICHSCTRRECAGRRYRVEAACTRKASPWTPGAHPTPCSSRFACRKQIAQDLSRATESKKLLDLRRLEHRFVNSYCRSLVERTPRQDRARVAISDWRISLRPDVDLLRAVGFELHSHRPAVAMPESRLRPEHENGCSADLSRADRSFEAEPT